MGRRAASGGSGPVVLGLSCDFHDAAAALLVDGVIVAAIEEERCSRVKHDASLPEAATRQCLEIAALGADEVDHIVFYEKPLAVAARYLAAKQREGPRSARSFVRDAPKVFGTNLMIGYRVARMMARLGARRPPPLQYIEHHLSHAASAFLASPFEHAAVLTVDGIGEWATATLGRGSHHHLELLEELRYPDSLGLAYSFVTAFCGFRPNDDEYKLMGLAPYGEPRFAGELEALLRPSSDGSIAIDARRLGWYSPRGLASRELSDAFGGPRRDPAAPLTQREADLAASVQHLTETAVLGMAERAHELTDERLLCMAGGVALNCVANGRIARDGPFDELWVQPAAGDGGGAIGAALAYWHLELGHRRSMSSAADAMSCAFLGPDVDSDDAEAVLRSAGVEFEVVDDDELMRRVATRLDRGDIVGWFRGRMEFGPRALGHRSLLADPRSNTVRERLNAVTKGREEFRPFAPAVLADRATEWFDLDQSSPYMLVVAPIVADRLLPLDDEPVEIADRARVARSEIPACTHVDGSARVQTVSESTNPDLHALLTAFDRLTGCPVLLNTSFNRAGEPIVATVEQAVTTARAGQVDLLVVGNCMIERP